MGELKTLWTESDGDSIIVAVSISEGAGMTTYTGRIATGQARDIAYRMLRQADPMEAA